MNPKDQTKPSRVEVEAEKYADKLKLPTKFEWIEKRGDSHSYLSYEVRDLVIEAYEAAHSLAQDYLKRAVEVIRWYADGIYPNDYSEFNPGEFRAGKRARDFLVRMRAGNESAGEGK